MSDPDLLKKIEEIVDSKITPVKELAEVTNHKVSQFDLMLSVAVNQSRAIKDQQSVINKKIDDLSQDVENIKTDMKDMKESLDANTASTIAIEAKIDVYADMYKINNDNIKKLDTRLKSVEADLELKPNPKLELVDVA